MVKLVCRNEDCKKKGIIEEVDDLKYKESYIDCESCDVELNKANKEEIYIEENQEEIEENQEEEESEEINVKEEKKEILQNKETSEEFEKRIMSL